jgi:hypothetical protein
VEQVAKTVPSQISAPNVNPYMHSLLDHAQHAIPDVRPAKLQEIIAQLAKMDCTCQRNDVWLARKIVKNASLTVIALKLTIFIL